MITDLINRYPFGSLIVILAIISAITSIGVALANRNKRCNHQCADHCDEEDDSDEEEDSWEDDDCEEGGEIIASGSEEDDSLVAPPKK